MGVLLDNIGRHAQKTLVKLLDENAVTFLGTDTHMVNTNYMHIEHMIKEFKKKIGETMLSENKDTTSSSTMSCWTKGVV